ncbi:MAG: tryptophan synthase subunit alpha [Planctomycetota bacterium]|jgi:tryptophan synthase alpha chain
MNRIDARFERLREAGEAAFIPFFTAGDPDMGSGLRLLRGVEAAGADVVELGFPFSDPIADGPTIQDSYHRALQRGQRVEDVFAMVREARQECSVPIVAMVSYSLVFRMGFDAFLERALDCGIDGATIPDLPVEEAEEFFGPAEGRDFRLICFATPATAGPRRVMVAEHARGFIYYISVRGITGERSALPADLSENIRQLKGLTGVPVAVGFGISRPEQARAVAEAADGVIVGSAIVKRLAETAAQGGDAAGAGLAFIERMAAATRGRA